MEASYGNYNAINVDGFLSGPISDTLSARLAVSHDGQDGWQRSYTSGQTNGAVDLTTAC